MYINNVHILYYAIFGILGLFIGQLINWCNVRLPEYKKVFSSDILKKEKRNVKTNYFVVIIMAMIYMGLLYQLGIDSNWMNNLTLIKFLILSPMLVCAFCIDYKLQIIPNRLTLTMFEIGLLFTFLYGIFNINIAMNMLLGMIVGGGIFLIITLIGGIQIFCVGILGQYLSKVYLETKNRPIYIVKESNINK